jgi:hypothetical protein
MSIDPTVKPASPPPKPASPPAPPAKALLVRHRDPDQVSFWQSFFLGMTKPGELPVYHHSTLFYWWPIWLLGFVFAALTYFGDTHMALVPAGTEAAKERQVEIDDKGTMATRDVLILKDKAKLITRKVAGVEEIYPPTIYMNRHKWLGTVFMIALLIVIVITSVTFRGLWSVFVLVLLIMLSIIFAVAGWWEYIFTHLGQLAIYINLGGYLTLSLVLFGLWCVNFFLLDRQTYMIFTPGQVRVRLEIGAGETVYDTAGMVFHKQRSDLFRHWVLGLGSGDLVVRPANLGYALELPNVLRVGRKVKQIEQLVKEKVVVAGAGSAGPPAKT